MSFYITDIIMVIILYIIVFSIIGASNFMRSKYQLSSITTRNIIHILCGNTILLLPSFSNWSYPFLALLSIAILIGLGLAVRKDGAFRSLMVDDSHYSRLHAFGPLYYSISAGILVILTWNVMVIGMAAVMIMAWGDGLASLIATRIKNRHKYPWGDKSLEGSLLVLIFGFIGALVAWAVCIVSGVTSLSMINIIAISLLGALAGSFAEAALIGPLKPFDNFTVPALSALVMYLALPTIAL